MFINFFINSFFNDKYASKFIYDSVVSLDAINNDFIRSIELLGPYGSKNPNPLFLLQDVKIIKLKNIKNNFFSCFVSKNKKIIKATSFHNINSNLSYELQNSNKTFDIVAKIKQNKWNNKNTLEIEIIDLMKKSGGYFNYNVSHHGNFVGIVSHTSVLVGMDIVDITTRAPWVSGLKEYIEIYRKQLSDSEVASIFAKPTELESYTHFYLLWSLKEAYVKAIGVGIGINLKEVEFDVMYTPSETTTIGEELQTSSISGYAKLCLQGIPNFNWEFQFMNLDSAHLLTVAKGPPAAALPTFAAVAWPQVPSHCASLQENSSCSVFKVDTTTLQQPTLLTLDQLVVI